MPVPFRLRGYGTFRIHAGNTKMPGKNESADFYRMIYKQERSFLEKVKESFVGCLGVLTFDEWIYCRRKVAFRNYQVTVFEKTKKSIVLNLDKQESGKIISRQVLWTLFLIGCYKLQKFRGLNFQLIVNRSHFEEINSKWPTVKRST